VSESKVQQFDCVIIGGGAAGLMCAASAGYRGRKVIVIDHANKVGKKILMSGGGRCNFTNLDVNANNYISANPHFCKSALSRYTSDDFIALVERHGIDYHEKSKGQLFCDNKAKDILNMLLEECQYANVRIETHCSVDKVNKHEGGFLLNTSLGSISSESLVIATGGLSIPTMGASGIGYDIAKQFGLACTAKHAALVPFTLRDKWLDIAIELAGVSLNADVSCNTQTFREAILFTHKGLSGPAILQISNYWMPEDEIKINFLPDRDLVQELKAEREKGHNSEVRTFLASILPKRFAHTWLNMLEKNKSLSQLSDKDIEQIAQHFQQWQMVPRGTEGYRTAEVTRGGIDTQELSSKTFESKKISGLYFIGEVVDVTGWLGGFNFQWAWASGYCAGQCV